MGYEIIEVDGVIVESDNRFPVNVFPQQHALDGPEHTGLLNVNQLPTDAMLDSEHQLDPHTMIIDGRDVSIDGSKLDTIEMGAEVNNLTDAQANSLTSGSQSNWHHHDDWYYRETELQTSGQSAVHWDNITNKPIIPLPSHIHDDRYYTETEIDILLNNYSLTTHLHDDRYYTESEIDILLNNYSLTTHIHDDRYFTESEITTNYYSKTELDSGQLNNIYYTETEIDTILSGYSLTSHIHDGRYYTESELDAGQLDNRYYTESELDAMIAAAAYGIQGSVNVYADLPSSGLDVGDIYIVKTTVGANEEGFYRWDGSSWIFLANNTGATDHNLLDNLNTGDYLHLSTIEYTGLTSGSDTTLHIHDDRYFTENEITTNYYSKIELDSGQLDVRYYTETEIDAILAGYSLTTHIHDDRYYTESEIDTLLNNYSLTSHIHDGRYYTETEINSFLNNYYTKVQLDNGQLNNIYYTETEIDTLLLNKSDIGHIHDDRYYTESEIDTTLSNYSLTSHIHDGRYYTESEIDTTLSNYSLTSHIHDGRYYTESELSSNIDGSAGADLVGATAISGGSATTVQGILEELASGVSSSTSTLDEAYDNGGTGLGREISVDSGPVKLNATSTDAPLELTSKTVAPTTNLEGGQISVINNILYIYDSDRSKWLSPSKLVIFARHDNSDGKTLSLPGGMKDWRSGIKMLHDTCILGVSVQTVNSINNKEIQVEVNGNLAFSLYTDSNGEVLNNSLNYDLNEGDYISVYVTNQGPAITDVVFTIELAWRK